MFKKRIGQGSSITMFATHAPVRVCLVLRKVLRRSESWAKTGACVANIVILAFVLGAGLHHSAAQPLVFAACWHAVVQLLISAFAAGVGHCECQAVHEHAVPCRALKAIQSVLDEYCRLQSVTAHGRAEINASQDFHTLLMMNSCFRSGTDGSAEGRVAQRGFSTLQST